MNPAFVYITKIGLTLRVHVLPVHACVEVESTQPTKRNMIFLLDVFVLLFCGQRRCIGPPVLLKLLHHDCSVQARTRAAGGAPRPFHCFVLSTTYTNATTKHTKYK